MEIIILTQSRLNWYYGHFLQSNFIHNPIKLSHRCFSSFSEFEFYMCQMDDRDIRVFAHFRHIVYTSAFFRDIVLSCHVSLVEASAEWQWKPRAREPRNLSSFLQS